MLATSALTLTRVNSSSPSGMTFTLITTRPSRLANNGPFPKTHVSGASSDREGTRIGRRGVGAPLRCRRGGRLPPEWVDDLNRNGWTI